MDGFGLLQFSKMDASNDASPSATLGGRSDSGTLFDGRSITGGLMRLAVSEKVANQVKLECV